MDLYYRFETRMASPFSFQTDIHTSVSWSCFDLYKTVYFINHLFFLHCQKPKYNYKREQFVKNSPDFGAFDTKIRKNMIDFVALCFLQCRIMWRLPHYPTSIKSEYGNKRDQILMDFDDFGVVGKLWISAFRNPLRSDLIYSRILILLK